MDLRVDRKWKKEKYTISNLYVDGVWFCNVIEDKDRGLKKTMSLAQIKAKKVPNETAIPTGTYAITMKVQSPKFSQWKYSRLYGFCKGYLPRLLGVPGFEGILIHIGNTADSSSGCLCVGINDRKGMVTKSTATFYKLYALLKEADERGENIFITIG